ncbi:MAG: polysaccharide biosynthesis tyrosine autokinase [Deltaproteobacteria bacterium]|nr:polysaccharide biosynthesis tyrosine autokinase [Deltaproteobacteria bacterium]MCL5276410.1 polysaccharide biosynthesis tyrosine autokinase [Deltaproteobacteria bacterium]
MTESTPLTTSPELVEYILLLRRKWKLIALITLLFFVSGTAYTLLEAPVYESSATIYIEEPLSRNNLLSDIIVMQWWNRTSSERLIAQSRSVAALAVEKLGLDYHVASRPPGAGVYIYRIRPADREAISGFTLKFTAGGAYDVSVRGRTIGSGTVGIPFTSPELGFYLRKADGVSGGDAVTVARGSFEGAVDMVRADTSIEEMGEMTNILKVSCRNSDPYLASLIANELVDAYIDLSIKRMSQEASQALDFISRQLEITNNSLVSSEEVMDRYKREHGIISLKAETEEAIKRISELEKARLDIALKIKDADSLKDMLSGPHADIGDYLIGGSDPVLGSMVRGLAGLEIRRKAMLEEYTEKYPGVVELDAQIVESKRKIIEMVASTVNRLEIQQKNIKLSEEAYYRSLSGLPGVARHYAHLERDFKVNQELYDFLLKKHEEARISKAATVADIRLIDNAVPSREPIEPKRGKNALVSFLLGLVLSLIIAFYIEYTDTSLKTVEDARRRLKLPIFGIIPRIPGIGHDGADGRAHTMLMSGEDLKSTVSEAYRSLRTNIQFADVGNKNKCFLITSAGPGEGKSITAANTAITLAYADIPTVLIDADFRKPAIHGLFDLGQEAGLTNYLVSDLQLADIVRHTASKNLDVITAGIVPPNPSELLNRARVDDLIRELKKYYSYVIFDTPPVLPVTDSAVLGSKVDGAFIVVELGKTTIEAVARAYSLLANTKTNVEGVILNKINTTVGRYGNYYYYYRYDRYYRQKGDRPVFGRFMERLFRLYRFLSG